MLIMAQQPRRRIATDGVSGEVLKRLLTGTRLDAAGETADAGVLVMADMTSDRLALALERPFRGYVEFRADDDMLADRIETADGRGDFCLTLTTPTAFSAVDTARVVCDALEHRGALPRARRSTVEMALHETVANAILHGNLGIDDDLAADVAYYEAFVDQLRRLLEQPEAHRRWIAITAWWSDRELQISVDDEGAGYEPPSQFSLSDEDQASGRGLAIVHALADEVSITKGGRCTALRFAHER